MKTKPNGYWTKENVFAEARKYRTKKEFEKGCGSAYVTARRNGWLSEMTWFINGKIKWTKEKVFEEARKYNTRNELEKRNGKIYSVSRRNGWLSEMTWLEDGRIKLFTNKIDSIYKYYWKKTNAIYVGRTLMRRQKIRDKEHIFNEKDIVHIYSKENGFAVPPMEIIENNLTLEEGIEREGYWVEYYRECGYTILNRAKTGAIGSIGKGKWTKEAVFAEARKYKTKEEFKKCCGSANDAARRNGWIPEMTWFVDVRKPNGYWTKERVFEEARKYKTKEEFKKCCGSANDAARRNGWIPEMTWFQNGYKLRYIS